MIASDSCVMTNDSIQRFTLSHHLFHWIAFALAATLLSACGEKKTCDKTVDTIVQVDGSGNAAFHDDHRRASIAQSFRPDTGITLHSVVFAIKKIGEPQGELKFSIHRQDGSRPNEDDIDGGSPQSVDASSIESDFFSNVTVEFPAEPELDANRIYYIVIEFTDEVSPDNYFQFAASNVGSAYANGELSEYDEDIDDLDDAWSSTSRDLQFTVKRCESVN